MIDLHSHILPGIDDGAIDLEMSLSMARMVIEDGTTQIACTPHFMSGVYDNSIQIVSKIISVVEAAFRDHDINLNLIRGGDIHIAPDIADGLTNGILPTIGESRYFLFEPPHHVLPPGIVALCKGIMGTGFIPVLTHPERLTWIENHYDVICQLDKLGVVVQLTAGSVVGSFGKRALYWSERMLDEGRVDIIASDAHNIRSRPPGLSRACGVIATRLGNETAMMMVQGKSRMYNKKSASYGKAKTACQINRAWRKRIKVFWLELVLTEPPDSDAFQILNIKLNRR